MLGAIRDLNRPEPAGEALREVTGGRQEVRRREKLPDGDGLPPPTPSRPPHNGKPATRPAPASKAPRARPTHVTGIRRARRDFTLAA